MAYPGVGDDRRFAQEDRNLSQIATVVEAGVARHSNRIMEADTHSDALRDLIVSTLDENKADEIVTIDLRGKSTIADHMVICSGRSSRQVSALSDILVDRLKTDLRRSSKVEGKDQGDWVLIDTGDVVVHIFRPEVREFYQLEKMWMPPAAQA